MAFTAITLSPATGLRDTTTYPTQPSSETEIRDAIQDQTDQVVTGFNNFLTDLADTTSTAKGSYAIGSPAISGVSGTNIHAQLENLKYQIDQTALGSVPDGSIGTAQIANDAITQSLMADDSVGADQIIDDAVGSAAIADNAILTAHITDLNVTENKYATGSVSKLKLSSTLQNDIYGLGSNVTYYVNSATGNDTTGDGSSGTPWATVAKAALALTMIIKKGYVATVNLNGTFAETLTLDSISGGGTIYFRKEVGASSATLTDIKIYGCTCKIDLYGLTLTSAETAIDINNSSYVYVYACDMTASGNAGITAANGSHVFVSTCTISNKTYALYASSASTIITETNSGTGNTVALAAVGGFIVKYNSTVPSGTSSASNGGQIFS